MSFDLSQLQQNLENLKAVHDAPVVIFEYRGLKIHLRDLDAEEDAMANEYAYAEVEAAARENAGRPDKRNFARSMAASFKYQIAYVALAIRAIEQSGLTWDVDKRPDEFISVGEESFGKFDYFLQMVGKWGSSIPNKIYEYLADVRQTREKEVDDSLHVELPDDPPALKAGKGERFKELKTDESLPPTQEEAAAEEAARLQALRNEQ